VLPDWDGYLTFPFGARVYAEGHRVWGHNLPIGTLLAALLAGMAYRFDILTRIQRWLASRWSVLRVEDAEAARTPSIGGLVLWVAVGIVATYSHLLADLFFSYGAGLGEWRLPLLWPVTDATWAWPAVPWGDVGTTVILAGGMFAMLRWRTRVQAIAAGTLALVAAYIAARGLWG
jgi:membrane-bound metal-dependent hydrolase YbcI (DUF457 family)